MLASTPIIAFVPTVDPPRAKKFFTRTLGKTLGLKLVSQDPYALVFDAGGTMLRVATVPKLTPAGFTVLGWIVPDITATVKKLAKRGVTFERFGFMEQDALGIWTSPSVARIAWFKDPDGNTLSLTEFSPPAATRGKSSTKSRRR